MTVMYKYINVIHQSIKVTPAGVTIKQPLTSTDYYVSLAEITRWIDKECKAEKTGKVTNDSSRILNFDKTCFKYVHQQAK